jgi:hypothetical protein
MSPKGASALGDYSPKLCLSAVDIPRVERSIRRLDVDQQDNASAHETDLDEETVTPARAGECVPS